MKKVHKIIISDIFDAAKELIIEDKVRKNDSKKVVQKLILFIESRIHEIS